MTTGPGENPVWRYGWVDRSIPEWVEANHGALPSACRVVLSTIDSGREVSSSPMLAGALGREPERPGRAMLLSVAELELVARTIFVGFEEVWILEATSASGFDDAPVRLDCSEAIDAPSSELRAWMHRHKVLVGLGDGLGLVYIYKAGPETDALDFALK